MTPLIEQIARAICGPDCDMPTCSCQPLAEGKAICRHMSMTEAKRALPLVLAAAVTVAEEVAGWCPPDVFLPESQDPSARAAAGARHAADMIIAGIRKLGE